jgi:hypothetical protein
MPITADRGDVIHFAGRHRLFPALRDGSPALLGPGEAGQRCGWAEFFDALRARGLVASLEPDDPSSFRLVPGGASAKAGEAHARRPGALAEARRFVAALCGRLPPA